MKIAPPPPLNILKTFHFTTKIKKLKKRPNTLPCAKNMCPDTHMIKTVPIIILQEHSLGAKHAKKS